MDSKIKDQILAATNSKRIESTELIQKLWNDYGDLLRIYLSGGEYNSVILKHIKIPDNQNHPKGFSGDISRKRKINSYLVETNWYPSCKLISCSAYPQSNTFAQTSKPVFSFLLSCQVQ